MLNHMRELLDAKKSTVNTRIWSMWPTVAEAAASTGNFDYLEFVGEYVPFTLPQLENFVRACELYNVGSMIKVDFQNRFYVAQRAMGCGFQAILFTDHETPDEVRETIRMVTPKTPQDGGRFGFPNGRWIKYNPELSQMGYAAMNRSCVKAFMIEKKEALDNIEEICQIPGVDMVQFGPNDYCMSRGWNVADHKKEVTEAQEHMIEVALKNGVAPRVEISSLEEAEHYEKLGVRHFCILDQMDILLAAWKGTCGDVKKFAEGLDK